METIYFIGGSPCAGKSTIAEMISRQYGLYYFKVDERLEKCTEMGAEKGYPICRKQTELSAEEIWMREPELQCREEFEFYGEVIRFVMADLERVSCQNGIVTEGAAYVPVLMKKYGVPGNRYISITPTREFQITHFRERAFIHDVLKGCRSMERAFQNWMERDVLFAQKVRKQCGENGYVSIINDGSDPVLSMVKRVTAHFCL